MAARPPGPQGLSDDVWMDSDTLCRQDSPVPGPVCGETGLGGRDELTPIATWMADQMKANATSHDVRNMRQMNRFDATQCITDFNRQPLWRQLLGLGIAPQQCVDMQMSYQQAALLSWALKVRQDGDWDHKPQIARRFNPRNPGGLQHWHLYGDTLYYYEVWSNLHYGYVGRAAGFSGSVLLDGAGAEQIVSTLGRLKRPQRSPGVSGMRAWDDAPDREAIKLGMDLHQTRADTVAAQDLLGAVLNSTAILKKPYFP